MRRDFISIWFFIGILLDIYGVMILGAGIYSLYNPPNVKMAHLHAGIWWGALLILLGLVYTFKFAPKHEKQNQGRP
jgi:hypothetical protein